MTERVTVWQCIGCGRIEGPQPCIGVCEDRRTELVYAAEHEAVLAQLARTRRQLEGLTAVVRQIAHTTPRGGECERTYLALQASARRTLESLAAGVRIEKVREGADARFGSKFPHFTRELRYFLLRPRQDSSTRHPPADDTKSGLAGS